MITALPRWFVLALLPFTAVSCAQEKESADAPKEKEAAKTESAPAKSMNDIRIVLHTDKGDIEATLFSSKVPMTAANFLNLAQKKYYDGITFHRVIADFMIQGG